MIRWCRQLAKLSEDRNAITRTFLSKPMRDVHTALAAWMARVGMTVRVDAIGNIRGVYPPRLSPVPIAAAPRFYIGSHLDTVPERRCVRRRARHGPRHCARRAARTRSGFHLPSRSSDSPTRKACGSARRFSAAARLPARSSTALLDRTDRTGRSLRDAIRHFGLDPNRIPDAQAPAERARLSRVPYRARTRSRESQPATCRGRCHFRPKPGRIDVRRRRRARRNDADENAEGRAGVRSGVDCRSRAGGAHDIRACGDGRKDCGRARRRQRRARARDCVARRASSGRSHAQGGGGATARKRPRISRHAAD